VHVDWSMTDSLSLKWISAYRKYEDVWAYDSDGSPFFGSGGTQGLLHEHITQELRLNGTSLKDKLDWTVGAYYVDQKKAQLTGQINLYYAQLNFIHGPDPTPSDSTAIFAHTNWHLADKLDLQVGYRYTEDSKFYQWFRHNPDGSNVVPCVTPALPGGANNLNNPPNCAIFGFSGLSNTFKSNRDDYRVALDFRMTDNLMLYGSIATGYKGGGLNPRPFFAVQTAEFGEEEVETTEVGLKATLANGRVRLNTAFFHNDQTGIQLNQAACETLVPQAGQTPFPVTVGGVTYSTFIGPPCAKPQNVGDANTDGIEVEMDVAATDRLSCEFLVSSIDFQ
jgi:iron complex outermembrane receptor protein